MKSEAKLCQSKTLRNLNLLKYLLPSFFYEIILYDDNMGRLEYEQNLPDLIYFGFGNFSFGRKTFELFLLAQRPLKEKKN